MNKKSDSTPNNGVSRRDLLKIIGMAAGSAVMYEAMHSLGFAETSPYKGPMKLEGSPKGASVLVLGAGIAGLLAAYELNKAGYKVKVLEYREKAGGRAWTLRGGDVYTELGGFTQKCQFDNGLYINPGPWRIPYHHYGVLDYCRELDVELEPFIQLNMNAYYHNQNAFGGKPQRIRHVLNDMQGHVAELLAKATQQGKLDAPFNKEDQEKLVEALREWGALDKDLRYVAGPGVSFKRGYDVDPGGGLMPRAVDSKPLDFKALLDSGLWTNIAQFQEYEYHQSIFQPKGGMDMIAQGFAKKIDNLVQYRSKVTRIQQNEKSVTVTYTDLASGKETQASADWCVCTIPFSILSQMPLDVGPKMREGIKAVPYDSSFKAGIQFKRRFWEEDERIFGGVTYTSLPLRNLSYPSCDFNKGGKGVVLSCYTFGPDAYNFSGMEPGKRLQEVVNLASQIHPQVKKEFDNGISVGWHRVPWTNGCYGMWTEEARKEHYDNVCQIDGRMIMAGEHISFWPAWIEGAVLSSMDAVERLHKRVINK